MDDHDDDAESGTSSPPEKSDDTAQTALLPKSLFPGKDCKPGEKLTLVVTHVYDDEIEVGKAEHDKDEDGDDEPEVKPPADMEEDSMYA